MHTDCVSAMALQRTWWAWFLPAWSVELVWVLHHEMCTYRVTWGSWGKGSFFYTMNDLAKWWTKIVISFLDWIRHPLLQLTLNLHIGLSLLSDSFRDSSGILQSSLFFSNCIWHIKLKPSIYSLAYTYKKNPDCILLNTSVSECLALCSAH